MLGDVRAIAFDLDNTLWDIEPVLERAEQCLAAWLQQHCPRIALSREQMRAAREQLARREPHNAHDVSYLRVAALAALAREHGYDEQLARQAFEVFLAARNQVEIFPDVAPRRRLAHRVDGPARTHLAAGSGASGPDGARLRTARAGLERLRRCSSRGSRRRHAQRDAVSN
jgi:putative hydrolase of the HAD superfamily